MSGGLGQVWNYFGAEVWEPLADYFTDDAVAPSDLFSVLLVTADDFLSPQLSDIEMEEARNSPGKARQRFLALQGTDFTTESHMVLFLEAVQGVIADYKIPGFEDLYRRLLAHVLRKFNLRYRLDEPFTLRFLLPASFANLYAELQRVNTNNNHLCGLLTDFEKAFDRYARTQDSTDLRHCIHMASNYVEGLASATAGNPPTGNTLGVLASRMTDWPHDKVRDALVNLYHFCSDYPGIRHGGKPASARRVLAIRDATLASLLLLSFAGYLSPRLDERTVLGI
jgi:hypothetical protein